MLLYVMYEGSTVRMGESISVNVDGCYQQIRRIPPVAIGRGYLADYSKIVFFLLHEDLTRGITTWIFPQTTFDRHL